MPLFSPIVPAGGRKPTYNRTDYSHSTVFTIQHTTTPTTVSSSFYPLTTVFTPPATCEGRWVVRGDPWGPVTFGGGVVIKSAWDIYKIDSQDKEISDPWYQDCQPHSQSAATYSPGVCPQGQTVAEITKHEVPGSTGVEEHWQASCCPSGMGFAEIKHARCRSTYVSSTMAYYPITSKVSGQSESTTFYETAITKLIGSANKNPVYETSTQTSTTTLAAGFAIVDPVVIAWQKRDLDSFPIDYASSVASQIGIPFTATSAAPGTSSNIPGPTSSATEPVTPDQSNTGLSMGGKIGIIVGSVGGFLVFSIFLICMLLRQRRRRAQETANDPSQIGPHGAPTGADASSSWWKSFPFFGGRRNVQSHMMSNTQQRVELGGKQIPVEMESPAIGEKRGGVWAHHAELDGRSNAPSYYELEGERTFSPLAAKGDR